MNDARSFFCWSLTLLGAAAAGTCAANPAVLLVRDGAPVWSARAADTTARVAVGDGDEWIASELGDAARAQLLGPTSAEIEEGLRGFFPDGAACDRVQVAGGHARVDFTLPRSFVDAGLTESWVEETIYLAAQWAESIPGMFSLLLRARAEGDVDYVPFSELLPEPPPAAPKAEPLAEDEGGRIRTGGQPITRGQPQPTGALSGASIFLSPGHGWNYVSSLSRWATQRPNTYEMIEDISNGEAVLQYLTRYLWNAGARVYPCRERDLNTNMTIVNNGGAGYSETGSWTTETLSGTYGGTHRRATVASSQTATARFTPNIPAPGHYAVYVWYRVDGSDMTTTDARIEIHHTGGTTVWTQNQQQDGYTWKYVGSYYFDAGSNAATGSVLVSNQGSVPGRYVIADAVRFGGGMGDMTDPDGGGVSGKPRWEESGYYQAGFMGKPDWDSAGTVTAMPRYAEWEAESWEAGKCIYLSWHSNASSGTARGTISFAYSSGGWGGTFNGVAGGDKLRNYVHDEMINDIRLGWESTWQDRGKTTANFGEINPSNNDEMPGALIEVAFHDNPTDAAALLDPNFRRIVARAVYQGIVKFYAAEMSGFTNTTLLPEPPTHLRIGNLGGGEVILAWNAPPSSSSSGLYGGPATGYRLYRSTNGKGFDNGTDIVDGTSARVTGLAPGETVYFRVTATNAGGESFPSETLAVRPPAGSAPSILIVYGFDRIDGSANLVTDDPYSSNPLQRGFVWLMNTYDYTIAHAESLAAADPALGFDACANEAVAAGYVSLGNYGSVIWILGEESTQDDTFSATEQSLVTSYLDGGGNLFVSGAEIGWDLEAQGNGVAFYQNTLHGDYQADDGGGYTASGVAGTIFEGVSLQFDNGASIYDVRYPDRITSRGGSVVCMNHTGAGSGGAGIQYEGGTPERKVVMLAFPFETITSASVRTTMMERVLDFFAPALPPAVDGMSTY